MGSGLYNGKGSIFPSHETNVQHSDEIKSKSKSKPR